MRLGIVSTVRAPGPVLDSFIQYHRAIGFERFLMFFDDPQDSDIARAQRYPEVTVIPCDEAYRQSLRHLHAFPEFGPQRTTFLAARQILNLELGMRMAADLGLDWLIHLDDDELFHSPVATPAAFFSAKADASLEQVTFLNLEAVPETLEVGDPFREVTLFKANPYMVNSLLVGAARDFWAARGHYFLGYAFGKSAARVDRTLTSANPHRFRRPDRELQTVELTSPSILHYPSCGLSRHTRKFETLGAAPDEAWAGMPNRLTFFREARDLCQTGDREGFRRLYEQAVMLDDAVAIEQHQRLGILKRIRRPAQLLAGLTAAPADPVP